MKPIIVFVALVVLACGKDPSEPPPPPPALALHFSAETFQTTGERDTYPNGSPRVKCSWRLDVSTSGGKTGEFAQWVNGRSTFTLTATGETSNNDITAADMIDIWGSDRVNVGGAASANRVSWWRGPFVVHYLFVYRLPTGEQKGQDYWLTCN